MLSGLRKMVLKVPIISELPENERSRIISLCDLINAPSGKLLLHHAQETEDVLFLVEGAVKLTQSSQDGKGVTIALLGPGAHIGVVSWVTATPRQYDVIATSKSSFLRIKAGRLQDIIPFLPTFTFKLLHSISKRLEQTSRHLAESSLYNLDLRLALRLLELAEVITTEDGECLLIKKRPSHQALAELLGVSREAISRSLRKLEDEKHIQIIEDEIFIISTPF